MGSESGCKGSVCTIFVGEEAEGECSTMCTALPIDRMRVPLSFTVRRSKEILEKRTIVLLRQKKRK